MHKNLFDTVEREIFTFVDWIFRMVYFFKFWNHFRIFYSSDFIYFEKVHFYKESSKLNLEL